MMNRRKSLGTTSVMVRFGERVYHRNRILLILVIICQTLILANGALTLAVDVISRNHIMEEFDIRLPKLTLLHSISWRNWKIMETDANAILRNGSDLFWAQSVTNQKALIYEATQSNYSTDILQRSTAYEALTNTSRQSNTFAADYDANLLALDSAVSDAVRTVTSKLKSTLESMRWETHMTVIVNAVVLSVTSLIRLGELYFGPKWNLKSKEANIHFAGSLSSVFLSVLESSAFIIITNTRLSYISTLIENDLILYKAAWDIKYLDPILTGSALRYAISNGSTEWLNRYNAALDPLTAAYDTIARFPSSEILALNKVNAEANQVLVDLETRALENATIAGPILTSFEYDANKALYLFAVDSILKHQEEVLFAGLASTGTLCEALVYFASILMAISSLLFITEVSRLAMSTKVATLSEDDGIFSSKYIAKPPTEKDIESSNALSADSDSASDSASVSENEKVEKE